MVAVPCHGQLNRTSDQGADQAAAAYQSIPALPRVMKNTSQKPLSFRMNHIFSSGWMTTSQALEDTGGESWIHLCQNKDLTAAVRVLQFVLYAGDEGWPGTK